MLNTYEAIIKELKGLVKTLSALKTRIKTFKKDVGKAKDDIKIKKIRKSIDSL
ncbi:MAG: hypothetical protein V1716_03215 [Candidatus Uhrbacteria bacterium]